MHLSFVVAQGSGPVHMSGGRMSKSETRKENSKIILEDGSSFSEVDNSGIIAPITADKRVVLGQISSGKISGENNEADYSSDILNNGKYTFILIS